MPRFAQVRPFTTLNSQLMRTLLRDRLAAKDGDHSPCLILADIGDRMRLELRMFALINSNGIVMNAIAVAAYLTIFLSPLLFSLSPFFFANVHVYAEIYAMRHGQN